jgi:predicted GNAT family N-acyltransferase
MLDAILIEEFKLGQETEISQLIKNVFDEFVAVGYSDAGNNFFYDWIDSKKIAERQQIQNNVLVARLDSKIIGMIEIRNGNTISLLFVDKNFHGKGIAKTLFDCALKKCIKHKPELNRFYVHASPYSVPIYKRLGFSETDTMQEQNGITYLPMEMKTAKDC